MDTYINKLLDSLSKTKFRGSFHLNKKMKDYVTSKGIDKIHPCIRHFIQDCIAPAK